MSRDWLPFQHPGLIFTPVDYTLSTNPLTIELLNYILMHSMKIQLVTKPLSEITSDYLVVPVFEGIRTDTKIAEIENFLKTEPKFGKLFESQSFIIKDKKVLLLGIGKAEKVTFITLQNWIGAAVKQTQKKAKQITIFFPVITSLTPEEMGEAAAIGAEIASFNPAKDYKSEYEPPKLSTIEILVERAERGYQDGLKKGMIMAEAINLVRRLGDMPANEMTPTYFLNIAEKVAKENKLKITVLDEKQAKKKGMGAFVGVAQGSKEPSFMIALDYKGDIRAQDKWGLIGKGITFDTGGLSLKPESAMHEMKYDMCGAAAVLGAMIVIAKLGVKANITGIMAVTENSPGGGAQRPGDIVKTYAGKTAEILNTDAEGRLVLIDALAYAQKDFKASKLIDLATLTGAVIVALGDFYTGVMGNNTEFTQQLITTGNKLGEKMWELPMDDEFNEMIKSEIADITNLGHGGSHRSSAGTITGAKFIEAGVENNTPWIHLDIAGTAWDMKPKPYRGAGATGVGVKTLVELISKS